MNEHSLSLVLVDVYARKHSSRHKVERLVYYIRYVAMWSDRAKYLTIESYVWTKTDREAQKKQNAFKGNWHYWVYCVLIYLFISNSCVLIDRVVFYLSPFAYGSMGQLCIYLKWTDDGGLVISHIHNYNEFINR
jgi:hypothetical protein